MGQYNEETLYVVSGHQRCGTSMMMDCLIKGGWGYEAEYDVGREEFRKEHADEHYDPNENGLYELAREEYMKPSFPRGYEGKLIKALNEGSKNMMPMDGGIRYVYMRRPYDQIRRSWRAFFGRAIPHTANATEHELWQERIIQHLQNRKDALSVDVFWYPRVVDDPLRHLEILRSNGWPIDVRRAAGVVDSDLFRHTHKHEPEIEKSE